MTRIDLHDLSYLADGTPRQRDALRVLQRWGIWEALTAYTPALAGTVPLGIDVDSSDLDVICEANDLVAFEQDVRRLFDLRDDVNPYHDPVQEYVCAWLPTHDGWDIELFAQPVPVSRQYACLHLLVEERLLNLGGKRARDAIRELKRQGMRTEPAFAAYFGIAGDPYEELARLADASDEELRQIESRAL